MFSRMRFHHSEPTPDDLEALERLGDRRAEIEAVRPADDREAEIRRGLLAIVDRMEEALCLYGRRARAVTEGWRRLAGLESPRRANREP